MKSLRNLSKQTVSILHFVIPARSSVPLPANLSAEEKAILFDKIAEGVIIIQAPFVAGKSGPVIPLTPLSTSSGLVVDDTE